MALTDDLKKNMYILIDKKPFFVMDRQYKTQGRQGGLVILKMRNLSEGTIKTITVNAGTKFEEIFPETKEVQYLYCDEQNCFFMDTSTFETMSISKKVVGDYTNFMKEGDKVLVLVLDGKVISVKRNPTAKLKVTESVDDVKSNAVTAVTKIVTLETGYKISVPLFVKKGDLVNINTESGEYSGRA
jgi:elongation factor P